MTQCNSCVSAREAIKASVSGYNQSTSFLTDFHSYMIRLAARWAALQASVSRFKKISWEKERTFRNTHNAAVLVLSDSWFVRDYGTWCFVLAEKFLFWGLKGGHKCHCLYKFSFRWKLNSQLFKMQSCWVTHLKVLPPHSCLTLSASFQDETVFEPLCVSPWFSCKWCRCVCVCGRGVNHNDHGYVFSIWDKSHWYLCFHPSISGQFIYNGILAHFIVSQLEWFLCISW